MADMVELFGHGERFLRTREMGAPERPEEEMPIRRSEVGSRKEREGA